MLKLGIIWLLAAVFIANSLAVTIRSNCNTGTLMMWGCSLVLVLYGIFHRQVDAFCETGAGRVLLVLFLVGAGLFIALLVFIGLAGRKGKARGDEKAIIVLGAGLRGEQVGDVLRRRLQAALDAFAKNPAALLVVTGGQGRQEKIPEAVAMKRWLLQRGVPQGQIVVEDKSVSTETNLLNAKALLQQRGVQANEPMAIVTNTFHCYRAGRYAVKLGFANARTVPATMNKSTFLPNYLREGLAVLYMWVLRPGGKTA